ncbi:MAG: 1-(5-phosphoribosyl)-5-((5-phosphoribosylamino)methylideneamino)imidazole-4-carboxamide isomerase, partial [Myxococcales bacterium]|nr:1-(5-phosphoribosyl)-5-((5-phosphoribosylamino)methylideneamino)imidazole-4-carboxamide isomerase [Myxococcales bacterium]
MAIPAIDLLHGKAVRLVRGDREQATVYAENPTELVARFAAAGARRLHLVDLDGAFGEPRQQQLVRAMVTAAHGEGLEVEVGGGLRSRAAVAATLTETGADYAVVGTLAVRQPEAAEELCRSFPGQ